GIVVSSFLVFVLRERLGPSLVKGWFKGLVLFLLGTAVALVLSLSIQNDQHLTASLSARAASLKPGSLLRTSDSNFGDRMSLWKGSLQMIRDHPFLGVGAGNWRLVAPRYEMPCELTIQGKVIVPDKAHNVYVQCAAEKGIGALL